MNPEAPMREIENTFNSSDPDMEDFKRAVVRCTEMIREIKDEKLREIFMENLESALRESLEDGSGE